jgi:hypothetical protein
VKNAIELAGIAAMASTRCRIVLTPSTWPSNCTCLARRRRSTQVRDVEVIELELALADLQQVEKRMERAGKDKKTGKAPPEEMDALTKLQAALDEGKQARDVDLSEKELESVKGLNLCGNQNFTARSR